MKTGMMKQETLDDERRDTWNYGMHKEISARKQRKNHCWSQDDVSLDVRSITRQLTVGTLPIFVQLHFSKLQYGDKNLHF